MRAYEVKTGISYYGHLPASVTISGDGTVSGILGPEQANTKAWKEPPHVAFANLRVENTKAFESFLWKYGPLGGITAEHLDGVRVIRDGELVDPEKLAASDRQNLEQDLERRLDLGVTEFVKQEFRLPVRDFAGAQSVLRLAWRRDYLALMAIEQAATGVFTFQPSRSLAGTARFGTRDLQRFMSCLFLIDYTEDRIRVCANPTCSTPYFVQRRKDQEYCTHRCAVLVNVRRSRRKN
jgi:hypothetical protein